MPAPTFAERLFAPPLLLLRTGMLGPLLLGALAAVVLGALPAPARAQGGVQSWHEGKGAGAAPTMRDLIPDMSSGVAYTERYSFAVDLEGGGHVGVEFTVSNLGLTDGQGGTSVRVNKLPGLAKDYSHSDSMRRSKWSYAKDRFQMTMGKTSVEGVGQDRFVLRHEGDVAFELTFQNRMPMWRPGNGRIDVPDGYYKFNLIAPRADVTGRVRIGGEWREVKATQAGYADHVSTNVAPYNLGKRFSRFRNYNKDLFVIWREIQLEKDFGGRSHTWIMVGYRDQIVFASPNATIKFADVRPDKDTEYQVPLSIQIDAANGPDSVSLVLRGPRYKRQDLLKHYGRAAKLVAGAVSKPWRYTVECDYTLRMTVKGKTATLPGKSHFTLDYVNP